MSVGERFSANVVRCRKRAGLSQAEAASRAGMSTGHFGELERGIRLPRLDTLMKLAGALGVSPDDLLEGITWNSGEIQANRCEGS